MSLRTTTFFVPGLPKPGGSKKYVGHRGGRPMIVDDCAKNAEWRSVVALAANKHMSGECLGMLFGPLHVEMEFVLPRPSNHFGSGKNARSVRASAPEWPTTKPDVLKLARSTEDALTGILWKDDSQTVQLSLMKRYGERPGCIITVGYEVADTNESLAPKVSEEKAEVIGCG